MNVRMSFTCLWNLRPRLEKQEDLNAAAELTLIAPGKEAVSMQGGKEGSHVYLSHPLQKVHMGQLGNG